MTVTSTPTQKVAIITGASQGFGAALVDAYRGLDYAVVANSRSITPSADPPSPRSQATLPSPPPRNASWRPRSSGSDGSTL